MNGWENFFGNGEDLTALQMMIRAVCMFFITLVLIRLSGMRTFGKHSAFDIIISIMLGAILSRGITGASPFGGVVAAAAAMVIIHRLLGWLSVKSPSIDRLIKGESRVLYKNGDVQWKNIKRSSVSMNELKESVRQEINEDSFDNVDFIYIDSDGKISVVKKKKE
ncbi:MAG TPA: YetF domain-containing protein [Chitinophagaceae bacterium]|nr:YetF domain-containing protein [Chitinophagaceae bacterium]